MYMSTMSLKEKLILYKVNWAFHFFNVGPNFLLTGHVSWTGPLLRYMVKMTNFWNFQYVEPGNSLQTYPKENFDNLHILGDSGVFTTKL